MYEFTLRHPGTFMYHSHYDEMTQIALGLVGMPVHANARSTETGWLTARGAGGAGRAASGSRRGAEPPETKYETHAAESHAAARALRDRL